VLANQFVAAGIDPAAVDAGELAKLVTARAEIPRATFDEALATKPGDRQLVWIDIQGLLEPSEASALARRFGLDARTSRALERPGDRPHLALHGEYFHVRVAAEPELDGKAGVPWLDVVGGRGNIVISQHSTRIRFLDEIDERVEADSAVGALSAATFVALLLDGAVTSYFKAVDSVEDAVDDLDARSLRRAAREDLLEELVVLRRRIARLRRTLAGHREVFAALADAGILQVVEDADAAAALLAVGDRFDDAISAVEDAREVLIGSFDVFMTRTAQRTNDIMKILAVTTVLLLPGSLIAGLLGSRALYVLVNAGSFGRACLYGNGAPRTLASVAYSTDYVFLRKP